MGEQLVIKIPAFGSSVICKIKRKHSYQREAMKIKEKDCLKWFLLDKKLETVIYYWYTSSRLVECPCRHCMLTC